MQEYLLMKMQYAAILDYSRYLEEISAYKRVGELRDMERSAFFKVMNAFSHLSILG
jgi:hypothetical protein